MERKINEKGGITIPKSMRRELGIDGKEKINLKPLEDGNIIVERIEGTCIFCHSTENVEVYKGKYICSDCREGLENGKRKDTARS